MAAFFSPPPPVGEHSSTQRQPIKLSGFAIPSSSHSSLAQPALSSATASASSHPSNSLHASSSFNPSSIDPSILFGLSSSSSSAGNAHASGWSSNPFASTYGASSILTDHDLDIENMLASFHQQQQQQQQQGHLGNPNAEHHLFGAEGGSGATTNGTAGSNGFLGAAGYGGIGHDGKGQQKSPHSFFGTTTSQPPSTAGVASIPHFARSPSIASSAISPADFFPISKDSPLGVSTDPSSCTSESFSPPPSSSSKRSPPMTSSNTAGGGGTATREGRSLSKGRSGNSDQRTSSRSRAAVATAGVGKAPRTTSRSRSARRSGSAAGYQDRPSPGNDRPSTSTTNATSSGTTKEGTTNNASHGSAAIIIPSTANNATGSTQNNSHQYSMSMPAFPPSGTNGNPHSLPSISGAGWFSQAGLSFLPPPQQVPPPLHSAIPLPGVGPSSSSNSNGTDPISGWKPSQGIVMPASAPAASASGPKLSSENSSSTTTTTKNGTKATRGAAAAAAAAAAATSKESGGGNGGTDRSKKNQSLEDVQEEEGDEKGSTDQVSEKRRKRRESHNAVERRRRDNINDRISELALLLPEAFVSYPPPSGANGTPPTTNLGRRSSSISEQGGGGAGENGGSPTGLGVGSLSLMSPPPGIPMSLLGTSPGSGGGGGFMMAAAAAQGGGGGQAVSAAAAAAAAKPNKGIVLAKSVEYIRYLVQTLELQSQQIVELQRQNQELHAIHGTLPPLPPPQQLDQRYQPHHPSRYDAGANHRMNSGEWAAFEDSDIGPHSSSNAQAQRIAAARRALKSEEVDEDDDGMDET